jgi:hypothetical protein
MTGKHIQKRAKAETDPGLCIELTVCHFIRSYSFPIETEQQTFILSSYHVIQRNSSEILPYNLADFKLDHNYNRVELSPSYIHIGHRVSDFSFRVVCSTKVIYFQTSSMFFFHIQRHITREAMLSFREESESNNSCACRSGMHLLPCYSREGRTCLKRYALRGSREELNSTSKQNG